MKKSFLFLFLITTAICLDYEVYDSDQLNMSKVLNTSLKAGMCSPTEYVAQKFIYDNNVSYNPDEVDRNVKFIVGSCNPVVLIPGIYSTKLKVRINCKKLKYEENQLYQKVKLYCNKYVCSDDEDNEENRDLWFNLGEKGFTLHKNIVENDNTKEEVYL